MTDSLRNRLNKKKKAMTKKKTVDSSLDVIFSLFKFIQFVALQIMPLTNIENPKRGLGFGVWGLGCGV